MYNTSNQCHLLVFDVCMFIYFVFFFFILLRVKNTTATMQKNDKRNRILNKQDTKQYVL